KSGLRTPTYDDRVLEITTARVDALLKGLAAQQPVLDRELQDVAEWERSKQSYPTRRAAYDKCQADRERHQAVRGRDREQQNAQLQQVAQRAQAAAMAGNQKEMKRLMDSLQ